MTVDGQIITNQYQYDTGQSAPCIVFPPLRLYCQEQQEEDQMQPSISLQHDER